MAGPDQLPRSDNLEYKSVVCIWQPWNGTQINCLSPESLCTTLTVNNFKEMIEKILLHYPAYYAYTWALSESFWYNNFQHLSLVKMFSPQKKLLSCGFEYENVASFLRHFSFSKHFFRLIGYIKEESHETKNKKKKRLSVLRYSIMCHNAAGTHKVLRRLNTDSS